jgi:uncharacterized protein
MKFKIHAELDSENRDVFFYDNTTNTLSRSDGFVYEFDPTGLTQDRQIVEPFSREMPLKKSRLIRHLKIQLGLSCNYSCDYCSQRFVERAPETSKKDIDAFIAKLSNLLFDERQGLRIELWGGEPLVYWKTMQPLTLALKEKFKGWIKSPSFLMITNGSLLTPAICDWLYDQGFNVAISHDAMGQSVRGPDPLTDPKQRKIILDFYRRMRPEGRISFNSMLHASNTSRKAIHEWFVALTNDPDVPLGEGSLVDSYDEGGYENSLRTKAEHFAFRQQSFNDVYNTGGAIGFGSVLEKIDGFTRSVLSHRPSVSLGQKCGMDNVHTIAVDLRGNVITCQNVSAVQTSMNGESHRAGHIDDVENVTVRTATHWANRPACSDCPVLHLCQGSCMFVEGKHWEASCENAYSDNIALFALAFEKITGGYIPAYFEADHLPPERRDIWGTLLKHNDEARRRPFPVKVSVERTTINEVEVYKRPQPETEEVAT